MKFMFLCYDSFFYDILVHAFHFHKHSHLFKLIKVNNYKQVYQAELNKI